MKSIRVAFASLFFLALSNVTDAATMSATFEKSLEDRLTAREAAINAYPKLRYSTYLPDSVRVWRVLELTQLKETMRVFKDSVAIQLPYQRERDPANADKIDKFSQDCKDFISFFDAGVKSGDISDATTAPPPTSTRPVTTRPATPPPTTSTPRTKTVGSGSEDNDSVLPSYTYTPYSWTPSTPSPYYPSYSTPSPYVHYYYTDSSSVGFAGWKIGLIVFSVVVAVIRFIYWMSKRQAKEEAKKKEEEEAAAAAAQVEGGEVSQATYVVVTPAENEKHPAGVPAKM